MFFRHALVFLRFIGEKYEDGIKNLKQTLKEQGLDRKSTRLSSSHPSST